jgi:hypothetical protein
MKRNGRTMIFALAIVCLVILPLLAQASSLDSLLNPISVFEPKKMVEAYNGSISSFFDVIAEGKNHSEIDKQFEVTLQSEADGEVVYASADRAIVITFYAPDENTKASKMTFWTSGKSEYKNIPQLVFGWAISSNYVDGVIGLDFFQWLNDSQDGNTYESEPYNAAYSLVSGEYSSFTLYPNK